MNNCIDIQAQLIPYLNKELTTSEIAFVIKHLAQCSECRKEVALILQLKKHIKPLEAVPSDMIVNAFRKIKKEDALKTTMVEDLRKLFKGVPSPHIAFEVLSTIQSSINKKIKLTLENC